jgi:hypothetical protein
MSSDLNVEDIPSRRGDLLKMLDGAVITRMVRYSITPPEEVVAERGIPESKVFSLTEGPLLLWLDSGNVIGVASQPSQISVTLWLEQGDGVEGDLISDEGVYPIEATDPRYSDEHLRGLLGRHLGIASLIIRDADDPSYDQPREAGVVLVFDGGGELILGHGLHNGSDDFAVLRRDQILPKVAARMREIPIEAVPR